MSRQPETSPPGNESFCDAIQPAAIGRICSLNRDLALDIIGFEPDRLGRAHARQYRHVIEFVDRVLEAQPFHGIAGVDVDDQQPTARDSILIGQAIIKREAREGPAAAWPRQTDDSMAADERKAARVTGTKTDRSEPAISRIDGAKLAGAGIQQPKFSIIESRRMRHRKAAGHDLAACYVDDDATIVPPLAPAVGDIRAADCADECGAAALHRQSIQVAAVFRHQRAEEFWPPQRPKTCRLADRRQATVQRIDEDRPARAIDVREADVVRVDTADDTAFDGYELAVRARRRRLAVLQHILEAPQHVEAARPKRLTVGPQALALLDHPLMSAYAAVAFAAYEKQTAGLVGCERETGVNGREPVGEAWRQHQHRSLVACGISGVLAHGSILMCRTNCQVIVKQAQFRLVQGYY